MMLLMTAIYTKTNRYPRSLIDRAFYKVPYLSKVMENFGGIHGTHENAHNILKEGNLLYLAPGGMQESLRPHNEKYEIYWGRRKGFARLAIDTQTQLYLPPAQKLTTYIRSTIRRLQNLSMISLECHSFLLRVEEGHHFQNLFNFLTI